MLAVEPLPRVMFMLPLRPRAVVLEAVPLERLRCSCAMAVTETFHCPGAGLPETEVAIEELLDVAPIEVKPVGSARAAAAFVSAARSFVKLEMVAWADAMLLCCVAALVIRLLL